jgi:hypothetical protein
MKFLYSGKYRRQVLIEKPFKRLSKVSKIRNSQAKMQIDFPSKGQIESLKTVVDATEIKLRGGSILSDYGTVVQGTKAAAETGLQTWDTVLTVAKSGNAMGEIMLGGHALGESIVELKKGHYFCCACSGIACSCFWVDAAASFIPGGYGVWQAATQAGAVTKGVTYTCRRVTGGF